MQLSRPNCSFSLELNALLITDLNTIWLMPTYSFSLASASGYQHTDVLSFFSLLSSATLTFSNHMLHERECHPVSQSMMRQMWTHSLVTVITCHRPVCPGEILGATRPTSHLSYVQLTTEQRVYRCTGTVHTHGWYTPVTTYEWAWILLTTPCTGYN